MQNGAVRAGAKRAVFADVSNTARAPLVTEDGVKSHDNLKAPALHVQESGNLFKPAQKPLLAKNVPSTTMPNKPTGTQASVMAARKIIPKKSAPVLRDSEIAATAETGIDETDSISETISSDVDSKDPIPAGVDLDSVSDEEVGVPGPVQPPQSAVIMNAQVLRHLEQESDEAVALNQSLITVNDDEYDEEEEEFYDQGYTSVKGAMTENTTGGATVVLCPRYTSKALQEIEEAKKVVESSRTPEDIEDDQWDTSMVAEYGDEIFEYMRQLEVCR